MPVTSIKRDFSDQPNIVRMATSDSLAAVAATGYLVAQADVIADINGGTWLWYASDLVDVYASDGIGLFTLSADLETLVLYSTSSGGGVTAAEIQDQAFTYAIDTGIADAYIVAYTPPITAYANGLSIWMKPSNNNTIQNPTLDAGVGIASIINYDGTSININDISTTVPAHFVYLNGQFLLLNPANEVTINALTAQTFTYGIDTGTADNYIANLLNDNGIWSNGKTFWLLPANSSTLANPLLSLVPMGAQIAINGPSGGALNPGDIFAGIPAQFIYQDGGLYLQNPVTVATGISAQDIQGNVFTYSADTGVVNAYEVTLSPAPALYEDGLSVIFNPQNTNTSVNITIDVNGLGPVLIVTNADVGVIQPGDLIAGIPAYLVYSSAITGGGGFQLLNPQSASQISSAITSNNYNFAIATDSGSDNYGATISAVTNNMSEEGIEVYLRIATTNNTNLPQLGVSDGTGDNNTGAIIDANGNNLLPGQLQAGVIYGFRINSTGDWICTNPSGVHNISSFAGDPNTNVAGNLSSLCIDITNDFLYYCSTAGDAASAVWTKIVFI